VQLRDLTIEVPLLNASGAFDVNTADDDWRAPVDAARNLGAYVTKTVTAEPRIGNPQPHVAMLDELTLVNSVGLANPGYEAALSSWAPILRELGIPIILSVAGTHEELKRIVEAANGVDWVAAYEINLSCPNVGSRVTDAADPARAFAAVVSVRANTTRAAIAKLSPACGDIGAVAQAVVDAGADAIAAVNTMPVRALDDDGNPLCGVADGGMSGRSLHPIALRCVAQVCNAVDVPVIGIGGVSSIASARRMFDAGASAISVGTAAAISPTVIATLRARISDFAPTVA
jgi:dihydroorotate dehydrogenase (NAD+) catalytic subunit